LSNPAGEPVFIVDSAHCPAGGEALARSMEAHFGDAPVVLMAGMMIDKNHREFFRALAGWANWREVICYTPATPRAEPAESLAEKAREFWPRVTVAHDLMKALELAGFKAEEGYRVVAAGTVYSVAPIQDWIREHVGKKSQASGKAQAQPQPNSRNP
jgi:dihydrofolate synthase/folylpolyglutamate synthase